MKLRIRGNSLRLRLSRGEVEALRRSGGVSERTQFGPGRALRYTVGTSDTAAEPHAVLDEQVVRVFLPASVVRHWADTDMVSIEARQDIGGGEMLRLLIEKDFACLAERPGEDDSDAFPHPAAD